MSRACRLGRSVVVCAAIALCGSTSVPVRAERADASATSPRIRPVPPAFRLGTAARPFGWSTAIGDLNADGRPDYAIADRLFRRPSGFAYSLQFVIAGVGSRSVTFDAPGDALTVSLRDVDHDRDLDVVVTNVVSLADVGVWLNDGAGRFHRSQVRAATDASAANAAALTSERRSDAAAAESVSRRIPHSSIVVGTVFGNHPPAIPIARLNSIRIADVRFDRLRPRAPPISLRFRNHDIAAV